MTCTHALVLLHIIKKGPVVDDAQAGWCVLSQLELRIFASRSHAGGRNNRLNRMTVPGEGSLGALEGPALTEKACGSLGGGAALAGMGGAKRLGGARGPSHQERSESPPRPASRSEERSAEGLSARARSSSVAAGAAPCRRSRESHTVAVGADRCPLDPPGTAGARQRRQRGVRQQQLWLGVTQPWRRTCTASGWGSE